MSASVGIGLATVVTMVTQRGPLFIVAALAGASAAGLYESAHRLALLGTIGTWATGAAVAPMVAAAHAGRDGGRLRQLVAGSILVSSAQALGVVFLLLLFGDWLLGLFGPAFVAAHATAVFLALAYLLNAIGGPVASACYMIGRERLVLAFNLAAAVTMAVAVTVGALTLGATGAALGFLLALMVGDGGMAIAARTVLGIGLRDLHPGRLALALAPPAEGGRRAPPQGGTHEDLTGCPGCGRPGAATAACPGAAAASCGPAGALRRCPAGSRPARTRSGGRQRWRSQTPRIMT